MNEEQAVLNFFSKPENLPLGLSVANLMDGIRERMNNQFWSGLASALPPLLAQHQEEWRIEITEDKNDASQLVGLHFNRQSEQTPYLRPMMEQQLLGGTWRIYYGLIWSATPTPEQLGLDCIVDLKEKLSVRGFKNNESFPGWQWTNLHPRRQDFLLRLSGNPQELIEQGAQPLRTLLTDFGAAIAAVNARLSTAPRSMTVSLDQLRSKRPAHTGLS